MSIVSITDYISLNTTTNVYGVSVGASAASIQNVLTTAGAGATVQFAAGQFNISEKLTIDRSDIFIKGAGEDKTTIVGGLNLRSQIFFFVGSIDETVNTHIVAPVSKGAYTLTLNDITGFNVGDTLYVGQSNDDAFIRQNYPNIAGLPATAENPLRETKGEIVAINGNTVTLKQPIAYDMEAGVNTIVQRWNMLHDVGISDLKITYATNKTPNPDYIANALPGLDNADAIVMNMVTNASVKNVSIINAASTGLEIRNAIDAHVDGLTVQGTFNKDESNGYGLHIAGSTNGTFENLNITDMRHAVVFSSWSAEIGNTVHVNYTNRDINYHGSDDYNNTVIVDRAEYREARSQSWALVGPGGQNHPGTDISKNINLFGYAVGSSRAEILYAKNDGAQLYGRGGNDTLVGGHGADIVSGDLGNDTLTGGLGADLFLHNFGDGVDVITDFSVGDQIALGGYYISDTNNLVVNRIGQDAEIILMNSARTVDKIILKNAGNVPFNTSNIVFTFAGTPKTIDATLAATQDVVQAGAANDIVRTLTNNISAQDIINLGAGRDTLRLEKSSTSLDTTLLENTRGIDVLDTSQVTMRDIKITQGFADTTDSGDVIISYGSKSIAALDTSGLSNTTEVILQGRGTVKINGAVTLNALSTGKIYGLGGDDVFNIESAGKKIITGGAGDDTFKLMGDYLASSMRIDGGVGDDTVFMARATHLSASDMLFVKGVEHVVFGETGNHITLNNTFMASLKDFTGIHAHTSLDIDVTGLTGAKTVTIGQNIDADFIGAMAGTLKIIIADDTARVNGSDGRDIYAYANESQFGAHISNFLSNDMLDLTALFDANGLTALTTASAFSGGYLRLEQAGTDANLMFDRDGAGRTYAASKIVTLDDILVSQILRDFIIV